MGRDDRKPVILLAFANDQDDRARYLRKLNVEASRLRQLLATPETKKLCETDVRQNTSARELLDVVIVDKVEELYTRPRSDDPPDELERFRQALVELFRVKRARPGGKLVLAFRNERLPEIRAQLREKNFPTSECYLKPLDREGIVEIVRGPERSQGADSVAHTSYFGSIAARAQIMVWLSA
jgi:Novel STAND NTPase 1